MFVIQLSAVGDEEEEVVPAKDSNPCTYREVLENTTYNVQTKWCLRDIDEMWETEEEAKKKQVVYLDDTSDEESVIVMQMPKKTRKEIICLPDSSDDENDKENAPNSKRYKTGEGNNLQL